MNLSNGCFRRKACRHRFLPRFLLLTSALAILLFYGSCAHATCVIVVSVTRPPAGNDICCDFYSCDDGSSGGGCGYCLNARNNGNPLPCRQESTELTAYNRNPILEQRLTWDGKSYILPSPETARLATTIFIRTTPR
jgi:hypothetical protein